ncbi:MAG TPA: histidinol-phosphate transaminase [Chryseosolibacter sp.]|nr:histidinol-phosphate transaminase [Chryseosolibacter sp.]
MNTFNRRSWLKTSLGVAGSIAATPFLAEHLMAAPMNPTEESFFAKLPATIKIRLNANENPYGPSGKAKDAAEKILSEANRYPFQVVLELKEMIAKKEGITPEHIAIGAGSGELLCATGAAFGVQGGSILAANPTFPLLMSYAEVFGAQWDKVDLNQDLEVDYSAMSSRVNSDTKLVFICNPNNPTGTFVDPSIVRSFCEEVSKRVTVFSDEAYIEFLEPAQQQSMVELVKQDANVIVSKTFSKIYGLAGLRIGYVIAKPDIIKKITKYQAGFSVNQTAIAAAKAVYGDEEFMKMSRRKNAEAAKVLTDYLDRNKFPYGKSLTNFIFTDIGTNAPTLAAKLAEKGIGIRAWEYQGKIWNRISVGTKPEMELLVKSMSEII